MKLVDKIMCCIGLHELEQIGEPFLSRMGFYRKYKCKKCKCEIHDGYITAGVVMAYRRKVKPFIDL